jgi:hypothetical protein
MATVQAEEMLEIMQEQTHMLEDLQERYQEEAPPVIT